MPCCAPAILSLRAECSIDFLAGDLTVPWTPGHLCDVALLRLRAQGFGGSPQPPLKWVLRFRSRVGLAALATGLSRTAS